MLDLNLNPTRRELRQFAGIFWPLFCAIAGSLIWRHFGPKPAGIFLAVGAAVALLGLAQPLLIKPLFQGWMIAAYPFGWVVSHVLMVLIYYGCITPIGLIMRAVGYDPMNRQFDRQAATYWHTCGPTPEPKSYFRQF
jgi:hypothetical protein